MLLSRIRGYANVFNVPSLPLDEFGTCEIIRPCAFMLLRHPVTATVMHGSRQVATSWNKSLRLWQDRHGLSFELDVEPTLEGAGIIRMVERGIHACSIGLITRDSTIFRDDDGTMRCEITRADIDHISIVDTGAFPGACCWASSTPPERLTPQQAAANRNWYFGKIAREQKLRAAAQPKARRRNREPIPLPAGFEEARAQMALASHILGLGF